MRRVAVVGIPGGGKSTLARAIGEARSLPAIHLDAFFFEPGWQPKPDEQWRVIYDGLVARQEWVIDGAFATEAAIEHADTVVVLDLPRWRGLLGAIRRNLQHRHTPPPDFAPGCRERFDKQFLRLLRFIWRYDRTGRVELEESLRRLRPDQQLVRLRSRREVNAFVQSLEGP
jgi:adenylate kinase family enzyme